VLECEGWQLLELRVPVWQAPESKGQQTEQPKVVLLAIASRHTCLEEAMLVDFVQQVMALPDEQVPVREFSGRMLDLHLRLPAAVMTLFFLRPNDKQVSGTGLKKKSTCNFDNGLFLRLAEIKNTQKKKKKDYVRCTCLSCPSKPKMTNKSRTRATSSSIRKPPPSR
jgi:hypothetical protein